MSLKLPIPQGLSFLRSVGWFEDRKVDSAAKQQLSPTLKLQTDKETYRPGDSVTVTIEICSPASLKDDVGQAVSGEDAPSLLLDVLSFELKGIEKLDTQWFSVPKPLPGSKQRRGEHMFLDCSAPSLVSKVIIGAGRTKTYIARVELPKTLPPSYRGISIRYFYYVRTTLFGRPVMLGNGDQYKGLVNNAIHLSKANDNVDLEEGYDSSKDEVSSVSSYNPSKAHPEFSLRSSLSMHSLSSRLSTSELFYNQVERPNFPSYNPIPRLSVSEISDDHDGGLVASQRKLNILLPDHTSNGQRVSPDSDHSKDDAGLPLTPKNVDPAGSEGFTTGRSYNIRIDDQVLLRFSPKNSDSTYYFGDMVLKFVLLQFLLCFDRVGYLSSMVADWWSTYLLSRNWKTEVPRGKGLSL
ncbi:hypothetical protein ZEAMMB73_Zm00001d001898 [Zea mays]|uniref:Uncharacterized protein n=1 Tax=Zea mays TaxID=4577 RepID=A0A1D6DU33_MAIZE|nr:hypothetical protein ZEAMMB73_Zm00001d001898 [Zea mays]